MNEWVPKIMQEKEILVEVQNVSKRFCKDLKRSIMYGFMDSIRALRGRDMDATVLRKDEFWAVKGPFLSTTEGRMPRSHRP